MHPPAVSLQCLMMMGAQPSCAGVGDDTAERHDPGSISNWRNPTAVDL